MTIDKQALLGADKHVNQHRLSRLIIEANSAELRAIAEAVEQYSNQLIAALEAEEKHIAELESKNSNLRTIAHEQNELAIRTNLDSINDAVEIDGLHKRIAELEARTISLEPFRSFVTDADIAALHRFAECCDDPESGGHNLEKEQVRRLESIGALQRSGRVSYITGFGDVLISITSGISEGGAEEWLNHQTRMTC